MAVSKTKEEIYSIFEELIREGTDIETTIREEIKYPRNNGWLTDYVPQEPYMRRYIDSSRVRLWWYKCQSLFEYILPKSHPLTAEIEGIKRLGDPIYLWEIGLDLLKATYEISKAGLIEGIELSLRTEIVYDYLDQAEHLAKKKYYCAAASLAGAVLENFLRTLCHQNNPDTTQENLKNINLLDQKLRKDQLLNLTQSKHIAAWAAIRNNADHGHFDKVDKNEVHRMIAGIKDLIAAFRK